jgi:hypothetical protein
MSMNKAEEIFCLKNGAKIMLFPIIFIDQLFSGGRRQNKPYFWHLFFGSRVPPDCISDRRRLQHGLTKLAGRGQRCGPPGCHEEKSGRYRSLTGTNLR